MKKQYYISENIECPYCKRKYSCSEDVIKDRMQMHGFASDDYATAECPNCRKKFDIKQSQSFHYRIEKPKKKTLSDIDKIRKIVSKHFEQYNGQQLSQELKEKLLEDSMNIMGVVLELFGRVK